MVHKRIYSGKRDKKYPSFMYIKIDEKYGIEMEVDQSAASLVLKYCPETHILFLNIVLQTKLTLLCCVGGFLQEVSTKKIQGTCHTYI